MRVLVTRPQPAASRTAEKLRAMGHEPVVLPLSTAVADIDAARAALERPHAAIALTSAQAVAVLADIAEELAPYQAKPVFAVGAATAEAARRLGFRRIVVGPGDGLRLAGTVAAEWPALEAGASRLLYLAGNPRSTVFEQELASHAIAASIVECYRMAPTNPQAELDAILKAPDAPPAILLYSAESAKLFRRMLGTVPPSLRPFAAFCLSPAVAEALADFPGMLRIAARPDEDCLLALLSEIS